MKRGHCHSAAHMASLYSKAARKAQDHSSSPPHSQDPRGTSQRDKQTTAACSPVTTHVRNLSRNLWQLSFTSFLTNMGLVFCPFYRVFMPNPRTGNRKMTL